MGFGNFGSENLGIGGNHDFESSNLDAESNLKAVPGIAVGNWGSRGLDCRRVLDYLGIVDDSFVDLGLGRVDIRG